MKKWNSVQWIWTIIIALLMSAIALWAEQQAVRLLSAISIIALLAGSGFMSLRLTSMLEKSKKEQMSLMMKTIHRRRHDWMNVMQLLYGYVKLKKYERLAPCVEQLKDRLQQESHASKMGNLELEWFMTHFIINCQKFEVELEVEEGLNLSEYPINLRLLSDMIMRLANMFEHYAEYPEHEQPHYLTINLDCPDRSVCCSFHYEGKYDSASVRRQCDEMKQMVLKQVKHAEIRENIKTDQAYIELSVPYLSGS